MKDSLSLILVILIISSILIGTIIVGEIIIRHSQIVKGVEISEKAFFAAESAMEKALYEVLKNYEDIEAFSLDGYLDPGSPTGPHYTIDAGDVTADTVNPFTFSLFAGESFQLNLDLNTVYPDALQIEKSGDQSDLIIVKRLRAGEDWELVASTDVPQTPSYYTLAIDSDYYYRVRINNIGPSGATSYTLTPTGADLPIGVTINTTGAYSGYERQLTNSFPKWQKFSF